MNLEEYRETVDFIDDEILSLLVQRYEIIDKIIDFKNKNNIPILNSNRENNILNKIILEHPTFKVYFIAIYKEIMNQSKKYQKNKTNKPFKHKNTWV